MFTTVGRALDAWYWARMVVAVWVVTCATILLGYAVLGWVFLKFLVWMLMELIAWLTWVPNPIVFDVQPRFVEIRTVEIEPPQSMGSFDIVDVPDEIDDDLPVLPPPRPVRVVRARPEPARLLALIGTMGTLSGEGEVFDVFESADRPSGILAVLSSAGSNGGSLDSDLSGLLGEASGSRGGFGVEGGTLGTGTSRAPPEIMHRPWPQSLEGVSCRASLRFDADGSVRRVRLIGCPEAARAELQKTLRTWRADPGVPLRMSTVDLPR